MPTADKDLLYLLRILEAIEKILLYSEEYNTADEFLFTNHQKDYNASLLLMMQIGEQASKVSKATKELEISKGSIFYQHINFSLLE